MAEELAAEHMRRSGFPDARRTPDGADAGIDVIATRAVAQVKYQAVAVGGPAIQQLRGAAHGIEHALFYASSGYTAAAFAAANATDVALFTFTTANEVIAVNAAARVVVNRGPQDGDDELVDDSKAAINRFYAWVDALKELSADGPSDARNALGEERLFEIAVSLESAMEHAMKLRGCFDRGIPSESRSTIRTALSSSNAATDAVGTVLATMPEPYATRFASLYTQHYLELAEEAAR